MKIFLGDLVHTWEKVSLWTMPLNVGYIASYAQKHVDENIEYKIFKRPELLIDAIKEENPDVVALSFYVWNTNLNRLIFDIAKKNNPNVLTVGGGPIFTNANAHEEGARQFFETTEFCDAYTVNQGERGFVELISKFIEGGSKVDNLRDQTIDGSIINDIANSGRVHIGNSIDPIFDLDEIPSPYLNGMMDSFFDEPFVPIIETNRSCPYRCTFCAWGIGTGKLARFSTERVMSEISYIADRCTKSSNLFIGDANFSVLERDADIATELYNRNQEKGYPAHVSVQWNKTRPDRVLRVARNFKGIAEVGASMQSLDENVLDAIKRRNLKIDDVADLIQQLRDEGTNMSLFSELILGLPLETVDSHIFANKALIDLGAEVFNYNLHLLPGTEMDSEESRNKYFHRIGWRLHDNAFGVYDGVKVFDGQEVVLGTSTMTMEELRSFRFIHFLLQFMWGRKWYYDYLHLFKSIGVHPVDTILLIAKSFRSDQNEMGELYARFSADHDLENFETFGSLSEFWSKDENLERLRSGEYGKLNYVFTYEILLEYYDEFNLFLLNIAQDYVEKISLKSKEDFIQQCRDVLEFSRALRVNLNPSTGELISTKHESFSFDLLAWRKQGYYGAPAKISTSDRYDYEFYLPSWQKKSLNTQLKQFKSSNLKLTLRKMSEEINPDTFFYSVRNN
jgi:radical SAM superfamily enzyme YgiQ (UPF0313 family)